jgi:hypothetical protein
MCSSLWWISTFLGKLRFLESMPPFFCVEDPCEWVATYLFGVAWWR